MGLKIAVIGAGSTYTPELIEGFIKRKNQLFVDSIYLMDIDREKMDIIAALTGRMLQNAGMQCKLVATENLDEALDGANYVLAQVRVGKLDARITDEKIPLKYGLLGQETTGIGGFMKGMRTIPVIMDIAKRMERLAPNAWLINFSNPSGLVAEAVLNNTNIKMMGLCNGPVNMIRDAKGRLSDSGAQFDYDFVGLNHLCWITSIYENGRDILKDGNAGSSQGVSLKNIPASDTEADMSRIIKGIPIAYLHYYYFREEQIKKCMNAAKSRGEECKEIEAELLQMYKDPELKEKPKALEKRGGALYSEAAVSLVDAIENDKNEVHVVDVMNKGAYNFMGDTDVVEVKCIVNKHGATPIKLENFDDEYIIGLMRAVKAYEKLAVKAALYGDYNSAIASLMVHPLIGDYNKAKPALDEMLEVNRAYLPQFFK